MLFKCDFSNSCTAVAKITTDVARPAVPMRYSWASCFQRWWGQYS